MSRDAWERRYTDDAHAHREDGRSSAPELAGFLAALPELPRTALDLGCGTGADAVYLAQQGIETTGLDFSPGALALASQRAEERGVRVTWVEGDVLDLPLADASMDLVTDHGCLHHVSADDKARYASEVARVLRPGGALLVREMNHAGDHEHAVTDAQLRAMITDLPLRLASIVEFEVAGGHGTRRATLSVIRRD